MPPDPEVLQKIKRQLTEDPDGEQRGLLTN
jgi:hypothetical protein